MHEHWGQEWGFVLLMSPLFPDWGEDGGGGALHCLVNNLVEYIIPVNRKKLYELARTFCDLWSIVPINDERQEHVHAISST